MNGWSFYPVKVGPKFSNDNEIGIFLYYLIVIYLLTKY